jgi:hypothetical protein
MKTLLTGILFTAAVWSSAAHADDRGSACVFSKEPKAALHIDPWAKAGSRLQRFGAVENGDEVTIQNCKGVDDQYLALVLGNRESSLASDSGNVVISPDLGLERCDFTPGIKSIPWLLPQSEREASIRSRIKTLRSCVALQVISLNGRPLTLGSHPTCTWTTTGPNSYVARGAACTFKIERNTAVSVKPIIEESCMQPERFESGELQSGDFNTALQAFVTSDATASSTSSMVGVSGRRIVFAPSPKIVPFDEESPLRFPKILNLKVQPVALDLATQRSKEDATSYVTMQLLVRNIGSTSSSFPVPLAAEAQLFELAKDGTGKASPITTWTAYASGQTLVPADWSGLFVTDRAEIPDFAFKHGRRYRIRLKYFHPHDVPGILQAELRNRPQSFAFNQGSFDVAKFPLFNLVNKVPSFGLFPTMGRGPQDSQPGSQISATEREILQFFRQLGVDEIFPARYAKACEGRDDSACVSISNATFIGQSIIDFTADSIPGQVSELRAISLDSRTKMITDKSPSAVHFEDREGIKCN